MRRALLLIAAMLLGALPFACSEDFSGGGGLPGDIPRGEDTGSSSDAGFDRADVREADAPSTKDVEVDTNEAGD